MPTTVSVWLDYVLEVLLRVVNKRKHRDFEIRWPTVDEMKLSAELLWKNRPQGHLLRGVFGVVDGSRMPCAHYVDPELQNAFSKASGRTRKLQIFLCLTSLEN